MTSAQINFKSSVYGAVSKIPKGKVSTYGLIACLAGNCKASRAVGNTLGKNFSPKIPCHRVIKSDRSIGGYRGNILEKIVKLEKEGVSVKNSKINLNKYCWPSFSKPACR